MTAIATAEATDTSRPSESVRLDIANAARAARRPIPADLVAIDVTPAVSDHVRGFRFAISRATDRATTRQR